MSWKHRRSSVITTQARLLIALSLPGDLFASLLLEQKRSKSVPGELTVRPVALQPTHSPLTGAPCGLRAWHLWAGCWIWWSLRCQIKVRHRTRGFCGSLTRDNDGRRDFTERTNRTKKEIFIRENIFIEMNRFFFTPPTDPATWFKGSLCYRQV